MVRVTDVVDVVQRPSLCADTSEDTDDRSKHRGGEHRTRRHLEVVAHLRVASEHQRLVRNRVRERLEDHVRDGVAGNHESGHELRKYAEIDDLVRDGVEDAHGDDEDEADDHANDVCPDWQAGVGNLVTGDTESEGTNTERAIPPPRDLSVVGHQAGVHVRNVAQSRAELADKITAVPDWRTS